MSQQIVVRLSLYLVREVLEDEDGISHTPVSSGSGTRLTRYMLDSSLKERSKEYIGKSKNWGRG